MLMSNIEQEWQTPRGCFLASCTPEMSDDPDLRMRLYKHASLLFNTSHSSEAVSDDTRMLEVDVLLKGVQDPWSSVRQVCVKGLGKLVLRIVIETQHKFSSEAHLPEQQQHGPIKKSSNLIQGSSSNLVGGRARHQTPRACTGTRAKMTHHVEVNVTLQQQSLVSSVAQFVHVLNSKLLWRWHRASLWYQRAGLLAIWQHLLPVLSNADQATFSTSHNCHCSSVEEENMWRELLLTVVLPTLSDPLVPLREAAAELLSSIASRSSMLASYAAGHVLGVLQGIAKEAGCKMSGPLFGPQYGKEQGSNGALPSSPLGRAAEAAAYAAEGNLLALIALSYCGALCMTEAPALELLMSLASYPASSVRQRVAEALQQPSDELFVLLLVTLAETGNAAQGPLATSWQQEETLLMALQRHLMVYLAKDKDFSLDLSVMLGKVQFVVPHPPSMVNAVAEDEALHCLPPTNSYHHKSEAAGLLSRCLAALMAASRSSRFEVSRMGKQVVPLLLQLWVRYAPCVSEVCQACTELVLASRRRELQDTKNTLQQQQPSQRESSRCSEESAAWLLPMLWWYVVVRHTTNGRDSVVNDIEEAVKTLATVEVLTACCNGVQDSGATNQETSESQCRGDGDDVGRQVLASTLLIISAYFTTQCEPKCVDKFDTDLRLWRTILTRVKHGLHYGLDCVPAMTTIAGRSVKHVVPLWTGALSGVMTHQQCILLAMTRAAMASEDATTMKSVRTGQRKVSSGDTSMPTLSSPSPSVLRPFPFVYSSTFAAPAMLDGGEDVMLGYTWMRAFFPTARDVPARVIPACSPPSCTPSSEQQVDAEEAVRQDVLLGLYKQAGAEPAVLHEARALLLALASDPTCVLDWSVATATATVDRLDTLCASWPQRCAGAGVYAEDAAPEAEKEEQSSSSDWDDDDGANVDDDVVQGISIDAEFHEARRLMTRLLECGRRTSAGELIAAVAEQYRGKLKLLLQ